MLIGYARVSTGDQDTALQERALREAGCERIFLERASGARWDRPELQRLLDQLRPGDVVVVWKLDRLTRSLSDLLRIMEKMGAADAGFRCVTQALDTTTPAGRAMMQMVGVFAEFERELIRERRLAGLASAREKGRIGGRPPKVSDGQLNLVMDAIEREAMTQAEAARVLGVHRSTITRAIQRRAASRASPEDADRAGG